MKAIETKYKGYRFRSRLEARWAVFFDTLGVKWEFEREGFELTYDHGGHAEHCGEYGCTCDPATLEAFPVRYLPDFFVHMLARFSRYPGSGYWVEIKGQRPTEIEITKLQMLCNKSGHNGYLFVGPPTSDDGELCYAFTAGAQHPTASMFFHSAVCQVCSPRCKYDQYLKAVEASRAARFEFGERGLPSNYLDDFESIGKGVA